MTSGAAASASRVDHPLFARIWPVVAAHEAEAIRALRRENLAGLSGRVLEVGAGVGTNFAYYPVAVEQVIAMEPEPRLAAKARIAAADAPVPIVVTDKTVEEFRDTETFDAVVCSLGERPGRGAGAPAFATTARRGAALSRACGQRRRSGPGAAVRRRDILAQAGGQLSHASPYRTRDPRRRIRGGQLPAGVGISRLGAATGVRVGSGPRAPDLAIASTAAVDRDC